MNKWIYLAAIGAAVALDARVAQASGSTGREIIVAQLNLSGSNANNRGTGLSSESSGRVGEQRPNSGRLDMGAGLDTGTGLDTGRGLEGDRRVRSGARFESGAGKGKFEFGAGPESRRPAGKSR